MKRTLFAFGALLAWLPAQEVRRERSGGEVRTADGKPFAGAEVHLLHRVHPAVLDPAYEDHVVATADEHGRFHAELLVGRSYAVWAVGPVVDDTYRCTEVAAAVAAGVPVVLHEGEPHFVRRLRWTVDASWPQPLRFEGNARVGGHDLVQALTPQDGVVEMPRWPVDTCWCRAVDGEFAVASTGLPCTRASLRRSIEQAAAGVPAPPPDDAELAQRLTAVATAAVTTRREWRVAFVGADGKPFPGVEVLSDRPRFRVGRSGADGVLRVGSADGELPYQCLAQSDGAETGVEREHFALADSSAPAVQIDPGKVVRGRLLLGDNVALAGAPVLLEGSIPIGQGTWFGVDARRFATGADGALAVPGRRDTMPFRLTALLTPAQCAALSPDAGAPPLWPRAVVFVEQQGPCQDLGDLRLDRLQAIDVQVQAADGSPPGAVELVMLAMHDDRAEWPHQPERMRTDRRGRLRFLWPRGTECAVFAVTKAGAAVGVAAGKGSRLALKLDPRHVVRLRLLDHDGKALEGARLDLVVPQGTPSDPDQAKLLQPVRDAFMVHGFPWKFGTTDAEGNVELLLPLLGCDLDLAIHGPDRKSMRVTVSAPVDRGPEPIEFTFVPNGR